MAISLRRVWIDLLLYPAHTLPTAAAPILVAAGLAARDGIFQATPALAAFLGSWLIHVAGVFTDNHELLRRYPSLVEHPDLSRALADGTLRLDHLKLAIAACLLLTLPVAIFLVRFGGAPAIVLGVVGLAASIGYAGGPVPYTRIGIAEPVFLVMFGVVAVAGTYYAQLAWLHEASGMAASLREVPLSAFLVGLPAGALVTNVLLIDDMRDREFDAAKGWRTIAVRFGMRGSRFAYAAMLALAYAAPIALWATGFGAWALLPLLTTPWAWRIAAVIRTRDDATALAPMTARASLLACAYAALSGVGFAMG